MKKLQEGLNRLEVALEDNQQHLARLESQIQQAKELLPFQTFEEIDWKERLARIEDAKNEIAQLERSSDQLATLKASMAHAEDQLKTKNLERDALISKKGKLQERIEIQEKEIESMEHIFGTITPEEKARHFPTLKKLDKNTFTLKNADAFSKSAFPWPLKRRLISEMRNFQPHRKN